MESILLGKNLNKLEKETFTFNSNNESILVITSVNENDNVKKCVLFKDNKVIKKIETLFNNDSLYNFIITKYKPNNDFKNGYVSIFTFDKKDNLISKEYMINDEDIELKIFNNTFNAQKNNNCLTDSIYIKGNRYNIRLGIDILSIDKEYNVYFNNILYDEERIEHLFKFNKMEINYLNDLVNNMLISIKLYEKYINLIDKDNTLDNDLLEYIDNNYEEEIVLKPISKVRKKDKYER